MSRRRAADSILLVTVLGFLLLQACGLSVRTPQPRISATLGENRAFPSELPAAKPSPTVHASRTPGTSTTPTSTAAPQVKVKAINGNIFIHRGPDLAFNQISVLTKGETAIASGRDVLSRWLRIPLPGDPSETGWVTIVTPFTRITGDVDTLPAVSPTEWPVLASIRNCTHDLMVANPGGITIPALDYFPDNEVQIDPGSYTILDVDVEKYPEVLSVQIKEGSAVDIIYDGAGEKHKCPPP
jgi:hypothetical protein